jgi:hypothetical protein
MEKKTIQINFRLSSDEYKALQNYANDNDLRQSDVIRKAIKVYIESPNLTSKSSDLLDRINALEKRTKALEKKNFLTLKKEPKPEHKSNNIKPMDTNWETPLEFFKEGLITAKDASKFLHMAESTIRGEVKMVRRLGKKGLFSIDDIAESYPRISKLYREE